MADSSSDKGKRNANDLVPDPIARTYSQGSSEEPIEDEKRIAEAQLRRNDDGDSDEIERAGADGGEDPEKRAELGRMKSYATGTSAASTTPTTHANYKQKPWYKQPNPLRWGKIPPVPQERKVCPEHKAGFFSLLFFQWMAPLMTVSLRSYPPYPSSSLP